MKKKVYFITVIMVLLIPQCWGKSIYKQDDFVNLLNIEVGYEVTPKGYFFSDFGNWHGYGFNNPSDMSLAGGFRGPAFTGERNLGLQWLSDCFEKVKCDGNC